MHSRHELVGFFCGIWSMCMLSVVALDGTGNNFCSDVRQGAKEDSFHKELMIGRAEQFVKALNLNLFPSVDEAAHTSSPLVERRIPLKSLGISDEDLGHHAGYFSIKGTYASRMFYLFFESRGNKAEDPVVVWMSGGPGCSSELALFYENGPYKIMDNLNLTWNDYGWDKASNILFVDQPIGTGFSYTSDARDIPHDEEGVSEDMYQFLQAFFQAHPDFTKNDFFVTGESYAGHYVPAVTSRIHQGNKNKKGLPINLKGFAIGNGLTNPEIQYAAYSDFALQMGLIGKSDHEAITNMYPRCEQAIRKCGNSGTITCITAYSVCNDIFNSIMSIIGDVNYYDIRKKCVGSLCYDFSNLETYLNQQDVKDALGVGDIDFVPCSSLVYRNMIVDWMRNLEVGIPALLEDGIQLLVYAGEYDLICNWLGNSRWVSAIDWSGKQGYNASSSQQFVVDGKEAGLVTSYGALSFLKVHDAGHMVPMDQPKASLEMITKFTRGASLGELELQERVSTRIDKEADQ